VGGAPPPKGCSVAWVWCCDARPFLWRPNLNPPPPRCVVGVVSASQTNHSTWSTIAPLLCVAILQTVTPPADSWLSKRHTFESRPPQAAAPRVGPAGPSSPLLSLESTPLYNARIVPHAPRIILRQTVEARNSSLGLRHRRGGWPDPPTPPPPWGRVTDLKKRAAPPPPPNRLGGSPVAPIPLRQRWLGGKG